MAFAEIPRGLSTLSAIDLLKQEYFLSLSFGLAWLIILFIEKSIKNLDTNKG